MNIDIKIDFENPGLISSTYRKEILQVRIKEPSAFRSKLTFKSLAETQFNGSEPLMVSVVPPILDEKVAKSLSSVTKSLTSRTTEVTRCPQSEIRVLRMSLFDCLTCPAYSIHSCLRPSEFPPCIFIHCPQCPIRGVVLETCSTCNICVL